jgi:hypothetical protein
LRARGIDHDVGAHLLCERAARRRIVGGDDRVQAPDPERSDDRKPDRAAADHQRHLAASDIGFRHRVDADGERLGQRSMRGRQAVRHLQQQGLAQQHALGIAADTVVGIADALNTFRRDQRRQRAHVCADLELALRARTIVQHLAAELVAEHHVA